MSKPLLIIIDGNSFMHRAFHGMPAFYNKEGFPTQVIAGVSNMINGQINKLKPAKTIVCFDHKGKTFRHDMFEEYKANRKSMDDDFRKQIEPLKKLITALGLPTVSIEGVEADDSISALAIQGKEEGYTVIMLTSDKDMCQIVQEDIGLLDTKDIEKGLTVRYEEGVKDKLGVYPNQIIPFLALVGDKADNVPGVDSVGEGTAAKWMNEYGTLENLLANKDNITTKSGEKFRTAIDNGSFQLGIDLVTIKTDIDFGKKVSEFEGERNDKDLIELVNKYELFGLKKALKLIDENAESAQINVITDNAPVTTFMTTELFKAQKIFAETIVLDEKDKLIISTENTEDVFLVDVQEYKNTLSKQVRLMAKNHEAFFVSLKTKNVINMLFKNLREYDVFFCQIDDMRTFDYLKGSERSKEATIENLNNDHCQFNLSELREEYKLNGNTPKWNKMSQEEILLVRSEEIKIAKHIFNNRSEDYDRKSLKIDNKLLSVLSYMESEGALVSADSLHLTGVQLDEKIEKVESIIYRIAGEKFKISSPKQVQTILFEKLEIPSKKKSTGEDVLIKAAEALAKNDELDDEKKEDFISIIQNILQYRSLTKLKSTYVNGLTERIAEDGRIHTTYNSTVTNTGRLSSTDPNLQNIPIRSEDGRLIRDAFIARKGYKIFAIDYSQIELRILADLANEINFINAFNNGEDIHKQTAANILGLELEDINDEQRRIAKAINFGLIYGMSERRLAEETGIEKKEAKKYYKGFFDSYPSIKPYFELELEKAKELLYVETMIGRKLSTKNVKASNSFIRSHAEKAAKNASIQGTAADIIKIAMIKIFEYMFKNNSDAIMIMQVHDELVFEVKEEIAEEFAIDVKNIMENVVTLKVPLVADYKIADNWNQAH